VAVTTAIVVGLLAVAAAVVLVAHDRRRTVEHLDRLTERVLGGPLEPATGPGAEAALARLRRALDDRDAADAVRDLAHERLERALDAVDLGVVVADEDGVEVYRNPVGQTYSSARHADALVEAAVADLIAEALEGRRAHRTLDLFGPPRRTLVITTTPLPSPLGTGALAVIDDITERRRLEAVRRDFVANISHELKTPVGALGLLAETLAVEDDDEVSRRLAGRIQAEAFRVGRTIEDLLELSRIESGELPDRSPVPVHVVVAEAVERIRPAAEHAGITIEPDEVSPRLAIFGDRRQLVSALYNLLDNAVKYSDAGSTVQVVASTDGTSVELAVTDHGIGIPTRDLERVFERFYRVDQARSRRTGGTGLGLAIVRHVVENHEGSARVESRLGAGSTFTLRLPTASGPVGLPSLGADEIQGGTGTARAG
jgi:two-component system, OmpR family, sensor histidine kinase SenX3